MRKFCKTILTLLLASLFVICLNNNVYCDTNNDYNENLEIDTIDVINGKRVGCMSGSIFDMVIKSSFPDSDESYFNSRAELLLGLKSNKIDSFLADESIAKLQAYENSDVGYIKESLGQSHMGFCFSDDRVDVRDEFNEYLRKCKEDGTVDKLQEKWYAGNAHELRNDEYTLTGEKGVLMVCTTVDAAPYVFQAEGEFHGYEVELMLGFCQEYGYDVRIDGASFDALLSSIAKGKYDVCFNGIYITEERKKQVNFSDEVFVDNIVCMVRKNNVVSESFIDSIKNKFYRTFIEEDRWQLILGGIGTTLTIALSSLVLGTLLGFVLFFFVRKTGNTTKKVVDTIAYIISGLPVVVLLMIMFYVVFAKSTLNGTIISIIAFTILIGSTVYKLLLTGVSAIDKGQFEGAYALGYTDNQTMIKFIIPQALRIVMPTYKGEIVSLIKSSSVVGYVTVQDLTRVSDIIRSRTYDAFFPLIVTAVIYFILAWLLSKLADHLQKRFLSSEKTKEEILKSIGQNK